MSNRRKPKDQTDPRCPGCGAEPQVVVHDKHGPSLIRPHDANCIYLLLMDPSTLSTGWVDDGDGYVPAQGADQ